MSSIKKAFGRFLKRYGIHIIWGGIAILLVIMVIIALTNPRYN
jgi:hypothetical protein